MEITFDTLLDKLRKSEPFQFVRYGDGEMRCILEPGSGANCDSHQYYPELGEALAHVLDQQNVRQTYYIGLQNFGAKQYPHFAARWPHIQWSNADILHHASIKGRIMEVLKAVREPLFVGPAHLRHLRMPSVIRRFSTVTVPVQNCWEEYDRIYERVRYEIERIHWPVVFFSCSMMAEPLIHRLAADFPTVTMIDAGSVWDPYCGVKSRSYHHKLEIKNG